MKEQDITPVKEVNEIEYFTDLISGLAHNQEILNEKLDSIQDTLDILSNVIMCMLEGPSSIDELMNMEEGDDNEQITG